MYQKCIAPSDGYHGTQYEDPVSLSCFINEQLTFQRTMAGDQYGSSFRYSMSIFIDGILDVSFDDRFIFEGQTFAPAFYSRFTGLVPGTGTTVVYL